MKLFKSKDPVKEKQDREKKCKEELDKLLKKYNCTLTVPQIVVQAK